MENSKENKHFCIRAQRVNNERSAFEFLYSDHSVGVRKIDLRPELVS